MPYEREAVRRAVGYTPGKQPASSDVVKLNTNENPYPPCEAVMRALRELPADALRRYPSPFADAFRATAARMHGVASDEIVAVNGGDELLRLAITTFVDPGAPIGILEPSYALYRVLAELNGSPVVGVPLAADWTIPGEAVRVFAGAGVKLVLVVNPHAPSGVLAPAAVLRELARSLGCVLVIDEAYVDFVDPARGHDTIPLVREYDNILILRTLSKGYSLAGLRFGYGIGQRALIEPMLTKTRDSYNVDAIAQRLATTTLEHRHAAEGTWRRVRAARDALAGSLGELGLPSPRSESNFLLAAVPERSSAAEVCRALEARGVLVRHFGAPRLEDKLRITVGTPEDNARLLAALRDILPTPR